MSKTICILVMIFAVFAWAPVYAQGNEPPIPDPLVEGAYILDTLNWLFN